MQNNKQIELTPVISSHLKAVGYNSDTQTLRVEFKDGAVWDYSPVKSSTYDDMLTAPSVGKFFVANIRSKYTSSSVSK